MKKFFDLQRFEDIYIGTGISNTLVSGTDGADSINNAGAIITIQAGADDDYIYNTGQIVKIYGEGGNDTINNDSGKNVTIVAGEGEDSVRNGRNNGIIISLGDGNDRVTNEYGQQVSISGGTGDDYIENRRSYYSDYYGKDVTISGGNGNDTIDLRNSRSDVIGTENNVIQYTEGDGIDVIYGFNSTDTLYVTGKSTSTMTSGNDFFVLFDSGSITIKDAASQLSEKNLVTLSGGTSSLPVGLSINAKGNTMTASKSFKGKTIDLTQYEKVKTLNASAVTQNLNITGNKLSNKISGGKGNDSIIGNAGNDKLLGETGNDTLSGGAGNDTLTGGKGNDVFVYTKGKDVITDYKAGTDKIFLQNTVIKSWKFNQKDLILTTETGTVTVKNGKGKKISFAMEKTFSSESALFAENNFVTADNLSEIVENNLTAIDYKISAQNFENLTQENLITFADK